MEFIYQAKDKEGNMLEGVIEAPSKDQAVAMLHRRTLTVLGLETRNDSVFHADVGGFFNKPSHKDVIIFTRQLATLIDADIPLLEALRTLSDQAEKSGFRKIISNVATSIEGGATLSLALSQHGAAFDDFYINLVRVGEVSGKLQETLLYLADYLERSAAIVSKIRGALVYPIFVLGALLLVGIIMMTSVIPQLLSIVTEAGAVDLPITTEILIWLTDVINDYGLILLFVVLIGIVFLYYYFRTDLGRRKFDQLVIDMPRFGFIARQLYIARIAETLATLIKAGVPILESLHITSNVVGNELYKEVLIEAEESVRAGGTISETIARSEEFPPLVSSMIATGERTGRIEYMLNNVLNFYEAEAQQSIKNISQLIEPMLILLLGLGVGGLVSAVLLPIYSVITSV